MNNSTVELCWIDTSGIPAADWPRLTALLDPAERQRAAGLRVALDRRAYVAAHAVTRSLLARHLQRPATGLRFRAGPYGKPEIDDGSPTPPLRFSLSHTRGMAAVAITRRHDVGVDMEAIDARLLDLDFAARLFAPSEVAHLRQLPPAALARSAFALWTLKEAHLKATGVGLVGPGPASALTAASFELDPVTARFAPGAPDDPALWLFRHWTLAGSHALAVALRHERPDSVRIDLHKLHAEEV